MSQIFTSIGRVEVEAEVEVDGDVGLQIESKVDEEYIERGRHEP